MRVIGKEDWAAMTAHDSRCGHHPVRGKHQHGQLVMQGRAELGKGNTDFAHMPGNVLTVCVNVFGHPFRIRAEAVLILMLKRAHSDRQQNGRKDEQ